MGVNAVVINPKMNYKIIVEHQMFGWRIQIYELSTGHRMLAEWPAAGKAHRGDLTAANFRDLRIFLSRLPFITPDDRHSLWRNFSRMYVAESKNPDPKILRALERRAQQS